MSEQIYLPTNKDQREIVLVNLIDGGKQARAVKQTGWWLAHYYLQGARDFSNLNYETGTLDVNYINEDGVLRFRYDEIVSKFQSQLGRLMQIDLRPRVSRRSIGLEDLRKASTAQIILDAALPSAQIEKLKLKLLPALIKYGCVALVVWSEGEEIGIDVVMPWELLPIPANPMEDKDLRGLIRTRIVPIDWVKKLDFAKKISSKTWDQMTKVSVPVGSIASSAGDKFSVYNQSVAVTGPVTSKGKDDKTMVDAVEMAEIWLETGTGYLATYEVVVGRKHVYSQDYTNNKTCMPIRKINDINTGDFWGRSFVSTQIPLNTELEYTLGRFFQNAQDLDAYGILCMPTSLGIPPATVRAEDGTKRIYYDPDYTSPDLKPFSIQPIKTGTFPAEVLKVGLSISDKMANQPTDLMRGDAPGRVDSQAGLGFLYETSNTPLSPTASAIASAMVDCYRAMLDTISATWSRERLVQISLLDDSLAGVVIDPASGTMSLESNIVPRPDEVDISVRSMMPRSVTQEKMELQAALKEGTIDLFEYRIEVRKRGLDLPVGNEPEWQNYRRSMMENIILFNDGANPGSVIVDQYDMHEVHLRVLQAFMARPEFFEATQPVRDAFKQHYQAHLMSMGAGMPDQAGYPEDMMGEEQMREKMMAQQMAGATGGAQGAPMMM